MHQVVVVTGPGSIGQAIARRVSAGKHVVLADLHQDNADSAAEVMRNAGFDVSTTTVDVSSRGSVAALVETATTHGDVTREQVNLIPYNPTGIRRFLPESDRRFQERPQPRPGSCDGAPDARPRDCGGLRSARRKSRVPIVVSLSKDDDTPGIAGS